MRTINPYINFHGKCREAMTFYHKCFGGELEFREVKDSPVAVSNVNEKNEIFHSSLTVNGSPLVMGSDMQDKNGYIKGTNIALGVSCNSEEDIRTLFENLSENGKIQKPL